MEEVTQSEKVWCPGLWSRKECWLQFIWYSRSKLATVQKLGLPMTTDLKLTLSWCGKDWEQHQCFSCRAIILYSQRHTSHCTRSNCARVLVPIATYRCELYETALICLNLIWRVNDRTIRDIRGCSSNWPKSRFWGIKHTEHINEELSYKPGNHERGKNQNYDHSSAEYSNQTLSITWISGLRKWLITTLHGDLSCQVWETISVPTFCYYYTTFCYQTCLKASQTKPQSGLCNSICKPVLKSPVKVGGMHLHVRMLVESFWFEYLLGEHILSTDHISHRAYAV